MFDTPDRRVDDLLHARQLYRVPVAQFVSETFTADERRVLELYFSNIDRPVFVLTNLPEVVKGALFARYSRSAKSVRRLFLDEFLGSVPTHGVADPAVGLARAERLYTRVFNEYGDDSVAQLGGAHIACEGVSNILTKILERGRLMAYLEQSTRYVPYTDRPGGRWKYVVPSELIDEPVRSAFTETLDRAFETYARWLEPVKAYYRERHPQTDADSDAIYRAAIRAKALDTLRGLLPAATRSNVGIFWLGSGLRSLVTQHAGPPFGGSARGRGLDAVGAPHSHPRPFSRESIVRIAGCVGARILLPDARPRSQWPRLSSVVPSQIHTLK